MFLTELINLAGLNGATPVDTPLKVNVKLQKDDGDLLSDPTSYKCLVGSLVYLTITRPDISYAANIASQFVTAPQHHHLVAVKKDHSVHSWFTKARIVFFRLAHRSHLLLIQMQTGQDARILADH